MKKGDHILTDVAKKIAAAVDRTVEAHAAGRIQQEPSMTDRMLGAIEEAVNGYSSPGVSWKAMTLADRNSKQESTYGADFMVVLDVDLPSRKVKKGFLGQAKLLQNGKIKDKKALKDQCEKMLKISDASYVFLYNNKEIRVVTAQSIVDNEGEVNLMDRFSSNHFFTENLQCRIGDRGIIFPSIGGLESLLDRYGVNSVLKIEAYPILHP